MNKLRTILYLRVVVLIMVLTYTTQAAEISIYVDNHNLAMDVPPAIINDRTMVPVRAISEAFDMKVEWLPLKNTVQIFPPEGNKPLLELVVDNSKAMYHNSALFNSSTVNSASVAIDAAPVIVDGRVLVPLRIIAEAIGFEVDWKAENNTVYLSSLLSEKEKSGNVKAIIEMAKGGKIVIEFFPEEAPGTVRNFITLAKSGFYDGLTFHRVIANFVAQGGCPIGDGTGNPGYRIPCEAEHNTHKHVRGSVSMAHAGKDTGGSQFFIVYAPQPHLDKVHTIFGEVVEGMDVADKLKAGDVMKSVTIVE